MALKLKFGLVGVWINASIYTLSTGFLQLLHWTLEDQQLCRYLLFFYSDNIGQNCYVSLKHMFRSGGAYGEMMDVLAGCLIKRKYISAHRFTFCLSQTAQGALHQLPVGPVWLPTNHQYHTEVYCVAGLKGKTKSLENTSSYLAHGLFLCSRCC